MKRILLALILFFVSAGQLPSFAAPPVDDPYLWLEEVTGDRALFWVRAQNAKSQGQLQAAPGFEAMRTRMLRILDSKDKLPFVHKQNDRFYNFWRDEAHPRGLWRRTTLAEYRKPSPAWETVLDLDALAKSEKESWVWHHANCLYPRFERCLVRLSRGGADAAVLREFDTKKRAFVPGGFTLPEGKSLAAWRDLDTLYVAADFGPGSLTSSGYPRIVKEWKRGTPLSAAKTIFEGKATDVSVSAVRNFEKERSVDIISRGISAFEQESFIRDGGKLVRIDVPIDADISLWHDQLLITLRSDWTVGTRTWPKGALLTVLLRAFLAGDRGFTMLFTPSPNKSLADIAPLHSGLVVNELVDVHNQLVLWQRKGGAWASEPLPSSALATTELFPLEPADTDEFFIHTTSFVKPSSIELGALHKPSEPLKSDPAFFDASDLVVEQHFARSKDGTRVPYFQVSKKGLALTGDQPTLLTGYGGFEVSLEPSYRALTGVAWMERGGIFVQANIRGGGEYGPAWHQAAQKQNRQRAYDDFIAVAEDLIARKLTSPKRLGIIGGSNGGLLMGVMLTERPELFSAIVCENPLLDMKRYHLLLAGASWMAEYGDPDKPEEWAAISSYSPYQNVKKGISYPPVLFTSSTRDDRVHPGHARKMVARMLEQGYVPLYYENIEGGHGGAADNAQQAFMNALAFAFLGDKLGLPLPQPKN
jgi:prolyl oligopeptidase